jgi:hypothetical protein
VQGEHSTFLGLAADTTNTVPFTQVAAEALARL